MISEKLLQNVLKNDFLTSTWIDKKIYLDMIPHYNCKIFSDSKNCFGKDFLKVSSGVWWFSNFSVEKFLRNHFENCQE